MTLREALHHRVPGLAAAIQTLRSFEEAIRLALELRRRGHVHLHNHFANDGGSVGYLASRYLGTTWSLTLHGTSEFDYPAVLLLSAKIKAAAFVACVSHFGRAQAMRVVDAEQWSKLVVTRCGVELDRRPERPRPLEPSTPVDGAPIRLLTVGRLSAEKGQAGLIAAFAGAVERGVQAELRLIGEGPQRWRIQREIERHRLTSLCTLVGRMPEAAVLREIAGADLFVLSSLMEGLPVVLIEAMSLGVPVIAPRVAGVPELVEHGITGLLFSPGNWNELADHIVSLVDNHELRAGLGKAGRGYVETWFDITRTVEPLYHELTTRGARSGASGAGEGPRNSAGRPVGS
jgi:glycosyltransferase involved in cell wall biosynthesis